MPRTDPGHVTLDDLAGRNFATVTETAAILEFDPRTLLDALKRSDIPGVRVGTRWHVPVAWLRAAVEGKTAGGAA